MTRVVVVGAGLLGSSVAHRLAERGASVTVAEANRPAAGTSGSSFAWVNAQDKAPDDYAALNEAGVRSYPELAAQIGGDWYHPGGDLVFGVGAGAAAVADRLARHEERGYPVRRLDRPGALALEPDLVLPADGDLVAGHFPDEAWIDVPGLVGRLLRAARSRGAVLDPNGPVDTVIVDSGRVGGVRFATGRTIAADAVVLAAGPQTEALAARIGIPIPMAPTPGLLAVSRPVAARIDRIVHGGGIAMRPDGGGRIMLSSRTVDAALDPMVTEAGTNDAPALDLLARGARLLPELATAGLESARIGYRSVPADGMPAVGFPPGIEGLYVLVSHSGVTLGPILGTLVAAELFGSLDPRLEPYRPARFAAAVG